jgi:hypothetical protein
MKTVTNAANLKVTDSVDAESDSSEASETERGEHANRASLGQLPTWQTRRLPRDERRLESAVDSESSTSSFSDEIDDGELLRSAQSHFMDSEDSSSDDTPLGLEGRPDGRHRSLYYDADTAVDDDMLDGDVFDEEETEAIRLQRRQLARLQDLDFTGGIPTSELAFDQSQASSETAQLDRLNQRALCESGDAKDDQTAAAEVLKSLTATLQELLDHIEPMLLNQKETTSPAGMKKDPLLSLVELKRQLLLNYGANLAFYLALKAEGYSVRDHPVIDRLIEIGVTLDKVRPLEEQIRIRMEALARVDQNENTMHRARLSDLESQSETNSVSDEEHISDAHHGAVADHYAPPHLIAEVYEDERTRRKRERAATREHARQRRDRVEIEQLAQELGDQPERIVPNANATALGQEDARLVRLAEARQAYEEEHLLRLPESKRERRARRLAEATRGLTAVDSKTPASGLRDLLSIADRIVEASHKPAMDTESMSTATPAPPEAYLPLGSQKKQSNGQLPLARSARVDDASTSAAMPDVEEMPPLEQPRLSGMSRRHRANPLEADGDRHHAESSSDSTGMDVDRSHVLYEAAEARMKEKRREHARRSLPATAPFSSPDDLVEEDQPRRITPQIQRNRGLAPRRPQGAVSRNPRVKRRVRYAQALKRRKGQVRSYDERTHPTAAAGAYSGETSGINKRARRSVNLSL